jgi:beta-N-acetylhexosaminidase
VAFLTQRSLTGALAALVLSVGSCAAGIAPENLEPATTVVDLQPETEAPEGFQQPVEQDSLEDLAARIDEDIAAMDLRTKLAGLMLVTIKGMRAEEHQAFLDRIPAAGFLLLGNNVRGGAGPTKAFLDELHQNQVVPLLIAVDQEGPPIARISGDRFPGAQTLGQGDVSGTKEAFQARQELVFRSGANVNFGVVADVSGGPDAYIHDRSFSQDPAIVANHVTAAVGARIPRVAQTLKHFPGHGMVFVDTHEEVPSVEIDKARWRENHGTPFVAGIGAGVELVMMAHIRVPSVSKDPASLSDDWIAILREELGFTGVIVTDDLGMLQRSGEAEYQDLPAVVVAALVAGNDLLLLATDPELEPGYEIYDRALDALVSSVESGDLSVEQVDQSLRRVLLLRWRLGHR